MTRLATVRRHALAVTGRVPRQVVVAADVATTFTETWMLLIPAVIAVVLLDALAGPVAVIAAAGLSWQASTRTSLRATVWLCAGVYVAIQFLEASAAVASAASGAAALVPAQSHLLLVVATGLACAGFGTGVLVVAIPSVRLASRLVPDAFGFLAIWAFETGKFGLAGLTVGLAIDGLVSRTGSPEDGDASSIVLTMACVVVGIVIGGVRADLKTRRRAHAGKAIDQSGPGNAPPSSIGMR